VQTYSLLDAPTMPSAFLGVSHNFSAWAGGLPEYFATAGIAPCSCGRPGYPVTLSCARHPKRPARAAGPVYPIALS